MVRNIQRGLKVLAVAILAITNIWLVILAVQMGISGMPSRWMFHRAQWLLSEIRPGLPFLPPVRPISLVPVLRDADRLTAMLYATNILVPVITGIAVTTLTTALTTGILMLDIPRAIACTINEWQAKAARGRAQRLLKRLESLDFSVLDSALTHELLPIRNALARHLGRPEAGILVQQLEDPLWPGQNN